MPFKVSNLVSFVALLFYVSIGLLLLLAKTRLFVVSVSQQQIVGGLFILFSIYKGYMIYRKLSKQHKEEKQT